MSEERDAIEKDILPAAQRDPASITIDFRFITNADYIPFADSGAANEIAVKVTARP